MNEEEKEGIKDDLTTRSLGLPKGGVRAIIALTVIVTACYLALTWTTDIPVWLNIIIIDIREYSFGLLFPAIQILLKVPIDFFNIFFYPWRFFNNMPLDSYREYLVSSAAIIAAVLTPQMPSSSKGIHKVISDKITKFISRFVYEGMVLYLALLYGIILYVIFLPFAYLQHGDLISLRTHFQGMIFVLSTLCIFCCIVLLFDFFIFKLFKGKQAILNLYTEMIEKEENRAISDDKTRDNERNNNQKKSFRDRLKSFVQLSAKHAKTGRDVAGDVYKKASNFQKRILVILLVYGLIYTFAAIYWLHL